MLCITQLNRTEHESDRVWEALAVGDMSEDESDDELSGEEGNAFDLSAEDSDDHMMF
jgi:hypothetical protein